MDFDFYVYIFIIIHKVSLAVNNFVQKCNI